MILWKLEHKTKLENNKKSQEADHVIDQHNQFQEGTYEKVMVMLKINKIQAQKDKAKKVKKSSLKKA